MHSKKAYIILFCLFFSIMNTICAQEENDPNESLKEVEIVVGLEKIITLDFVPNSIIKICQREFSFLSISSSKKASSSHGS